MDKARQPLEDAFGEPGDALLAQRARQGDREAFGCLVERYAARLHALAWRLTRDPRDAEDLVQESFLRAYRHLSRFDPARPFRAWLYAIATNVGFNMARARRRQRDRAPIDDYAQDPATQCMQAAKARHAAQCAELRESIEAALDRLPPRDALLVHLHYTEGLTIAEAAEVAGMREGAAKTALCRARKQLREWLAGE